MQPKTASTRLLRFAYVKTVPGGSTMKDHSSTVLESQLDWLTCSYRGANKARALRNFAMDAQALEAKDGNNTKPWQLNGYQGFRTGRVRYGDRDNSCLIQLSGQLADDWAGSLVPDADTVTRLDMAVTLRMDPPQPDYGEKALDDFMAFWREHPLSAVPWTTNDAKGGYTAYVGSRRSPIFLRLYNKAAEQASEGNEDGQARYANAWRYELECHDAAAKTLAVAAVSSADRAAYVSGYVHDYCVSHGHHPLYVPSGDPVYRQGFRRRSDYQSRLRWFASKVAPAIRDAMNQGDPNEVLRALGLQSDSNQTLT